jgi:hypothetical protein
MQAINIFYSAFFQRFQVSNRLLGEHDIPLACVDQVVTGT